MSISDDIAREIVRWNTASVEPTHVVMTWAVAEALATEVMADRQPPSQDVDRPGPWRVWGLPIVLVSGLATGWAVGTDRPVDADRMRGAPTVDIGA